MMVFSFLFVVLTLPRISVLVNVFLKIVEKDSTNRLPVRRKHTKRSLDLSMLLSSSMLVAGIEPATSSLPWMRSTD